ncbi:MAG: thioredoxin-disulfide reductase [Clostridia bacterium]|nr:thioredoxin-disulfide reductase [Clostridia bacterium]
MEKIYDMIIIGGGPAGYTAALYGARAGLDLLLIERMSPGGQMTLTGDIDNYPGFEAGIDGFTLGMKMQESAHRFGAKTEYDEVLSVKLESDIKEVKCVGNEYFAKTVVIATGADPRRLGIENEDKLTGRGVHYCAHCDGRFYKDKTVVVVGGGNSAVSDALYLSRLAKKVYLVHRRDTLRASAVYLKPLKEAESIEFVYDSVVEGFIVDEKITGVNLRNVKSGDMTALSCDGVFVSIGRKPTSSLFEKELALDENGYIIADETTKTSVPGVFAVGDVRTKELRQVITAAADGALAAHHAEQYLSGIKD